MYMNTKEITDIDLVYNIKSDKYCNESILTLSEKHTGLYNSIVNRYFKEEDCCLRQDVLDEKMYIVFKSAQNYNPDMGTSFSTHFANETKWVCLKNKNKKSNKELCFESSFLESICNSNFNFSEQNNNEDFLYLKKILSDLIESINDPRAKEIIKLRYFSNDKKNTTWKKISKKVELSIQGCINIHNKYLKEFYKKIKSNHKEITNEY